MARGRAPGRSQAGPRPHGGPGHVPVGPRGPHNSSARPPQAGPVPTGTGPRTRGPRGSQFTAPASIADCRRRQGAERRAAPKPAPVPTGDRVTYPWPEGPHLILSRRSSPASA
ncbi:MAG: hypothetical protein EPO12_19280 [Aquabacterium sp.]|nr:MAG: hypothetical protein EPO12_19280 [Aquabacterium sp.]